MIALAALFVAASTGCCCLEKCLCNRPGWCNSDFCCETGCDTGCSGDCGGGCDDCSGGVSSGYDDGPVYEGRRQGHPKRAHGGHPLVYQERNSGHQHRFDPGPASPSVTYPYYTNRGPRDFLARSPRSTGP
jgi:hypothetical protein